MVSARDNLARQNIFIPATQPDEQITLRVAAYCRVSSDSADQLDSFATQNTHYAVLFKAIINFAGRMFVNGPLHGSGNWRTQRMS